ncbi:patellin-3-like [Syzygium oleosum]|uniref:patellin-3-like n=1 Tax=Syzygium oleosum TaxID=219896 RepID=UPI0011D1BA6F|nr:patellin-3-like [Syzygium oleosum]
MAEETQKPAAETAAAAAAVVAVAEEVVVVPDVPPPEKELPSAPEPEEAPEKPAAVAGEPAAAEEKEAKAVEEEKVAERITESVSYKETNVYAELPEAHRKALDELKVLIQEALNKHELSAPPPPPPPAPAAAKEEEKPAEEEKKEVEEEKAEEKAAEAEAEPAAPAEEAPKAEAEAEAPPPPPAAEEKVEEEAAAAPPAEKMAVVVEEVVEKLRAEVDEDGAKTVEVDKETIVEVATSAAVAEPEPVKEAEPASEAAEPPKEEADATPPPPPEEVSIWGIPLLADEKSDVILLKFLRARDFKVKDAFVMIKNTVRWRKEFGIEAILEEELGTELDKVVFTHGFDTEGHPVCYNVYGEFQNKDLYQSAFADEEKRKKFLKWRIQFLEKSIRKLDFSPTGVCTIFQVNDLKNSPGPAKRELRQATSQALQLLQDNYPEFVAKQVFINVPWWYLVFNRMISPFLTQRTKSKFVVSRSTEILFKYIAPEQVPVQYGGLSREGEHEFTTADAATDFTVKPYSKHTIEFPVTEKCLLVWEVRVVGWDVVYGAEFVPSAEGAYTVIVQKTRKVAPADETIISETFKGGEAGKIVLTIDNQSSKKKKLLYRSKTKAYSD